MHGNSNIKFLVIILHVYVRLFITSFFLIFFFHGLIRLASPSAPFRMNSEIINNFYLRLTKTLPFRVQNFKFLNSESCPNIRQMAKLNSRLSWL